MVFSGGAPYPQARGAGGNNAQALRTAAAVHRETRVHAGDIFESSTPHMVNSVAGGGDGSHGVAALERALWRTILKDGDGGRLALRFPPLL